MSKIKRGLGKGLGAFFSDSVEAMQDDVTNKIEQIKITQIKANKEQPRKNFEETKLRSLSESIKRYGVLQPIIVKLDKQGGYQIIAGERRWKAAQMAGLKEIPAIIREMGDIETLEVALIENLQRADLNVVEEAKSYKYLMDKYHLSQEEIANRVGKSRPVIANTLRLLNLPRVVQEMLEKQEITAGHARVLLMLEDGKEMESLAKQVINEGWSVKDLEEKIKNIDKRATKAEDVKGEIQKDKKEEEYYKELQQSLKREIKRGVKIDYKKKKLEIKFFDQKDLIELVQKLKEIKKYKEEKKC